MIHGPLVIRVSRELRLCPVKTFFIKLEDHVTIYSQMDAKWSNFVNRLVYHGLSAIKLVVLPLVHHTTPSLSPQLLVEPFIHHCHQDTIHSIYQQHCTCQRFRTQLCRLCHLVGHGFLFIAPRLLVKWKNHHFDSAAKKCRTKAYFIICMML